MRSQSLHGMMLALAGALVISPDALLMRLSGLDGPQMPGWRRLLMDATMIAAWIVLHRRAAGDPAAGRERDSVRHGHLACADVGGAVLGRHGADLGAVTGALFLGERAGRATLVTSVVVLAGISLSVLGRHGGGGDLLLGVAGGLGAALCLGATFTTYRAARGLPILWTVGLGGLLAGAAGFLVSHAMATSGPAFLAAGVAILPVSFFLISTALRHTEGANVSLFMLLESVLGPLIVWLAIGERVPPRGLAGGAVVIGALAIYLLRARRLVRSS